MLRVALYAAMKLHTGCLCLAGPMCSSWGMPARSTTMRSLLNVQGVGYPFVVSGNLQVARSLVSM